MENTILHLHSAATGERDAGRRLPQIARCDHFSLGPDVSFRGEAEVGRAVQPAASVDDDPKATFDLCRAANRTPSLQKTRETWSGEPRYRHRPQLCFPFRG
jgi:hypothetical protein